jgi:hypothetical protein
MADGETMNQCRKRPARVETSEDSHEKQEVTKTNIIFLYTLSSI